MSSTNTGPTTVLDTGRSDRVWAVAFHPDGKHLLGGSEDGIRRWRLSDGEEVGKQTGMKVFTISVSRDHTWIVCGTLYGASVWDGELHERVIGVEGNDIVWAVDVSPDSTRFATGTDRKDASLWSITSGKQLVGPLRHVHNVTGVQFSPNGARFATACQGNSISIFDSQVGDKLVTIKIDIPDQIGTLFAWSLSHSQQIFGTSRDNKIRSFDVSTGSQLAELQFPRGDKSNVFCVALAAKFLATFAGHSISLLDISTLTWIGPIIEDSEQISSIAISPDGIHLATGGHKGKIIIRDLGKILPDLCSPFNSSTPEEVKQDDQPLTSDSKVPGSTSESSRVKSKEHNEDGDHDLLEVEVPSSTPAPQFDYDDESLSSVSSAEGREGEIQPVGSCHAISQLSDTPPIASSPPAARPQEHPDTVNSPQGRSMFTKWRQRKSNRSPTSPKPGRLFGKSREPASPRPPSSPHTAARVDATNRGPSWMAAGQRRPRTVATSWEENKSPVKTTVPKHPKKNAMHSGQGSANANEASRAQQTNGPSQPPAAGVHLSHQQETGISTFSISFPTWMLCFRSGYDHLDINCNPLKVRTGGQCSIGVVAIFSNIPSRPTSSGPTIVLHTLLYL